MDFKGGHKPYALIEPNKHYHQQTRPGAVWMLAESMSNGNRRLGYFTVGDRKAKAIVPKGSIYSFSTTMRMNCFPLGSAVIFTLETTFTRS